MCHDLRYGYLRKMVEYCREKTAALGVVKPLQLDVASEVDVQLFIEKEGTVDHILASFLLHWILDQKTGLRNIFNLLKPGGDFFAVHLHNNLTIRMNIEMQKSEQWGGYFTNLDHHVPKLTTENHFEVEHRHLFTNCGFVDTVVHLKRSRWTLAPRVFVPLIQSVHVQIINIPKDRIDEYMKDYVELGVEKNCIRVQSDGGLEFDFNTFTVFGRRPE